MRRYECFILNTVLWSAIALRVLWFWLTFVASKYTKDIFNVMIEVHKIERACCVSLSIPVSLFNCIKVLFKLFLPLNKIYALFIEAQLGFYFRLNECRLMLFSCYLINILLNILTRVQNIMINRRHIHHSINASPNISFMQ